MNLDDTSVFDFWFSLASAQVHLDNASLIANGKDDSLRGCEACGPFIDQARASLRDGIAAVPVIAGGLISALGLPERISIDDSRARAKEGAEALALLKSVVVDLNDLCGTLQRVLEKEMSSSGDPARAPVLNGCLIKSLAILQAFYKYCGMLVHVPGYRAVMIEVAKHASEFQVSKRGLSGVA